MGGMDHGGKPGAGGEFAKQASTWLTPNVPNGGCSVSPELVASKGATPEGEKRTVGLESQTRHWATPRTITGGAESAERKKELGRENSGGGDLQAQVKTWDSSPPAPTTPDGGPSSPIDQNSRRRLNPAFGCWLMGWPCWWTNPGITSCAKSEMVLYRSALQRQLSSLLGEPESSEARYDRT